MAHSPEAKTWIAVGLGIIGIALTVVAALTELLADGASWPEDARVRVAFLLPLDLVASALLLLLGTWLLAKLTGDSFGKMTVSLPGWLGVYYFAVGIAAVVGTFVWWLVGCILFVGATAAMVYWVFDASGLGCVLAAGMVAVVRVASLVTDILVLRAVLPPS